jgi:uncharacterized protein (DUF39 family)
LPYLIVLADIPVLNDKLLTHLQQEQEDIDVSVVFSQMADVYLRRTDLRRVIPEQESVARISARR